MGILDDSTAREVKKALAEIARPVRLVVFTQGKSGKPECRSCADTGKLAEEVAALNDRILLDIRDLAVDSESAETMHIEHIPAVAVLDGGDPTRDFGIRFYGIPAGYEFSVFIEDLLMVGGKDRPLDGKTAQRLDRIRRPIHLRVFTTPTCPRCPQTALLAHRLAFFSADIRADVVEAMEFPHLINRYNISGVPLTVVNEVLRIEGAHPEEAFIEQVLQADALPAGGS